MTRRMTRISVIIFVIMTSYMFFVTHDMNDKLSSMTIQVNHDKTSMTNFFVTVTKKDDKSVTMTKNTDEDGFVTFNHLPKGQYLLIAILSEKAVCGFYIDLHSHIQTLRIDASTSPRLKCNIYEN